jgi:hypothetical protein
MPMADAALRRCTEARKVLVRVAVYRSALMVDALASRVCPVRLILGIAAARTAEPST